MNKKTVGKGRTALFPKKSKKEGIAPPHIEFTMGKPVRIPRPKDKTILLSEKPIIAFRKQYNNPCTNCQGFTITGEGGTIKIQGGLDPSFGKRFVDVLSFAANLRDELSAFVEEGGTLQHEYATAKLSDKSLHPELAKKYKEVIALVKKLRHKK